MQPCVFFVPRLPLYSLLLAVAGLVGCQALPRAAAPQSPFDHVVKRGQLVLHSDFELSEPDNLLAELAGLRDSVSGKLSISLSDRPIHIYLFGQKQTYDRFLAARFPGFPRRRALFVETDAELAVYAQWGENVNLDLRHEVTHGYLHGAIPNLPLWLDEGLAEYFEVAPKEQGLNRPHVDHLLSLDSLEFDLDRLENLISAGEMTQRDYAESWAWVHLLLHRNASDDPLRKYLADLQAGQMSRLWTTLAIDSDHPNHQLRAHLEGLSDPIASRR